MNQIKLKTVAGETDILVPGSMEQLEERVSPDSTLLIVDENVLSFHQKKLEGFSVIPVKQGEQSKSLESYADIFRQLLEMNVDRTWKLVGVGGGIVTDLLQQPIFGVSPLVLFLQPSWDRSMLQ